MYTNQATIESFLQRSLNASEVALLTTLLPAIDIWINAKTGSRFDQVTESTRYYEGGYSSIDIDPATNITAVGNMNDDGVTQNYAYVLYQDYILEPQNSNVKREIVRRVGYFARGLGRISVTAKFSEYDNGVPEDIVILATRLAAGVIQGGKTVDTSNLQSESLEGHSVTYGTSQTDLDAIGLNDLMIKSTLDQRREYLVG